MWWRAGSASGEFDAAAAVTVETASGTGLRIYQRQDEQGETRLYCESERRKQKETAIVERAGERLEQALGKLHAGAVQAAQHETAGEGLAADRAVAGESTRKPRHTTRSRWRRTRRASRRSR